LSRQIKPGHASNTMFRIILIVCLINSLFIIRVSGQEKDSIILYNGEVLIGTVQEADLGVISIDDIDLKMQNIKLYKIKTLIIKERFKIETVDKTILYGSLKTSDKQGWVDIHAVDGTITPIRIIKIYQLISFETNFFKRLNGNVSAGFSFTKSSEIGQVNFSANVQFATKLINYQLSASTIASLDSGKYSRDNENVQLFATYDLTTTWFLAGAAQYQRNLELSIARRYLGLFGPGNKLFIEKTWRLLAVTGMTISQEKSTEDASSTLLFEIPVMLQFNYYQFHHPDIQISSTQTVYFSLSQKGRVRYDGTTNFSWQLVRYFYLNISPYTNFDSQPPAGSGSTFDFGIVLGISYKF
jgi:hypothetical protein